MGGKEIISASHLVYVKKIVMGNMIFLYQQGAMCFKIRTFFNPGNLFKVKRLLNLRTGTEMCPF